MVASDVAMHAPVLVVLDFPTLQNLWNVSS